jgi:hypothetical protein
MALIKKQVSDIERKLKYARIVMFILKKYGVVKEFIEYTKSEAYHILAIEYLKENKDCSLVWYDKDLCADVLGMCNFSAFLEKKGIYHLDPYKLVLAYLFLFEREEYNAYCIKYGLTSFHINNYLGFDSLILLSGHDLRIFKQLKQLKELGYGNKICNQ